MIRDLECIRCQSVWPLAEYPYGCPKCAAEQQNSNLFCRYADETSRPYENEPDLGQGNTPLLEFDWLPGALVKNEAANPTGSHKDRFAATLAAHAKAIGKERIVIGSSGNAGLAIAAFAAASGLRCAVAGFTYLPQQLRDRLTDFGAELHLFETDEERTGWVRSTLDDPATLVASNIAEPTVGSHFMGIEGYKAIGHELPETDHVVIPSSRGDLAWGIYLGLRESTRKIPKLHLYEPIPRLTAVLGGTADVTDRFEGDYARQWSISGDTTTVQALHAVTRSGGSAHVVSGAQATTWYHRAARKGLGLERSSAGIFAAYVTLRASNIIRDGEQTVLLATSHFYKGL